MISALNDLLEQQREHEQEQLARVSCSYLCAIVHDSVCLFDVMSVRSADEITMAGHSLSAGAGAPGCSQDLC
jgi:hypothetical protein